MSVSRLFLSSALLACLLAQATLAESATYHLKRLEIQARAFVALAQLEKTSPAPGLDSTGATVDEQLQQAVERPSWAENMVLEDVKSLLSTTAALEQELVDAGPEEFLRARVELESLSRRLRVSTSPLQLDPQQTAALELMMLELDESANALSAEREQMLAQKESNRRRTRIGVGVGFGDPWGWGGGWGGWGGAWAPVGGWGGVYNPYFGGFYRPYPYGRGPICR